MRDQGVTPAALAWILQCSWIRAVRLSLGSTSWTCTEVYRLVDACTPAPARRHEWAPIYAERAA